MNDRTPPTPSHSAALRRLRFGAWTITLIAASIAAALFINIISDRLATTIDLTAGGQSLSPRTQAILDSTDASISIILSADLAAANPAARAATLDALDLLNQQTNISTTTINLASPTAPQAIATATEQILALQPERVEPTAAAIARATAAAAATADALAQTALDLNTLTDTLDQQDRAQLYEQAAVVNVHADTIRAAAAQANAATNPTYPAAGATAQAFTADPPLAPTAASYAGAIERFANQTKARAEALNQHERQALAQTLAAQAKQTAQSAAEFDAAINSLTPLAAERIDATLRQTPAIIVVAHTPGEPPRTVPLLPDPVLRPSPTSEGQQRANAQWLLATAIAAAADPAPPVVVLTHANAHSPIHTPRAQPARDLTRFIARLQAQRIDVIEWTPHTNPSPPATASFTAQGRPIVYWVSAGVGQLNTPNRGQRRIALADAIDTILDQQHAAVINLGPSELPGLGLEDPVARTLQDHNINADTARILITHHPGNSITTAPPPAPAAADHPLATAIDGIPTRFPDAVPLKAAATTTAWSPVLAVPHSTTKSEEVWTPTPNWLNPLILNRSKNLDTPFPAAARHPRTPKSTTYDPSALILERTTPRSTRQLVVASDRWYTDPVALDQISVIDGRAVNNLQGNAELTDAIVYRAASKDARIAQTDHTQGPPRIPDSFTGTTRTAITWALTLGVPVGILILGSITRTRI